jgi:hypothetical protein
VAAAKKLAPLTRPERVACTFDADPKSYMECMPAHDFELKPTYFCSGMKPDQGAAWHGAKLSDQFKATLWVN